jgi:hypothetical protein
MRSQFNFEPLDNFVSGLIKKKRVVSKHRAHGRFRAAVVISAKLARAFERSEHESNEAVYRARVTAKKLAAIDPVKSHFPEAAAALTHARQIYELFGTLPVTNWRKADRFHFAFISNLAVYWRRLTNKRAPKADAGRFVNFVAHAFSAVGIQFNADIGRSVRQIIGRF